MFENDERSLLQPREIWGGIFYVLVHSESILAHMYLK